MSTAPKDRPPRYGAQRRARHVANTIELSQRSAAWIVGPVVVGLLAVFMAIQSDYANRANKFLFSLFPLAPLVFMPAGFALLAFLSQRYFPGTAGSGIPQTIAAIDELDPEKTSRLLSIRIIVGKIGLTLGGLLMGASIGREGPTVQVGASVMHFFYGKGSFRSVEKRRILILAGGAAGISSAFNTPLAGIMFAIEALSKKHVFNANSSALITVIFAGLISLFFLGNYTYFGSTNAVLDWRSGALAMIVCGVIGGAAGGVFSRAMVAVQLGLPPTVRHYIRDHRIWFAAACGLGVAVLGLMTDGAVFGTGYDITRQTLENRSAIPWHFGLAKMLATLLSSVSGISGGLFAPSLAAGAGLGDNIAALFPDLAPHSAIVILVMAAYLSGVTREPITSFIIMMEMTDSRQMLLPLMAATVVASGVSKLICRVPLYQALAENFAKGAPSAPS
jgi:H+/Cl- antiporter ClcA